MGEASRALLLCVFVTGAVCLMDKFVGKGHWIVNDIRKCPDSENYPMQAVLKRRKMNRTHDGFNLTLTLPDEVNDNSHGVYLELCKHVDGGCKTQFILEDDSFCHFARQYIYDNMVKALTYAGRDPQDCPVAAGYLSILNYVFDYTELPEDGFFGEFEATFYLLKEKQRLLCFLLYVNFLDNRED